MKILWNQTSLNPHDGYAEFDYDIFGEKSANEWRSEDIGGVMEHNVMFRGNKAAEERMLAASRMNSLEEIQNSEMYKAFQNLAESFRCLYYCSLK